MTARGKLIFISQFRHTGGRREQFLAKSPQRYYQETRGGRGARDGQKRLNGPGARPHQAHNTLAQNPAQGAIDRQATHALADNGAWRLRSRNDAWDGGEVMTAALAFGRWLRKQRVMLVRDTPVLASVDYQARRLHDH